MRFVNKTKNSVYLEDVDLSIPYIGEKDQFLDTDRVKKSHAFQQIIALGGFEVVEASQDRIEQNLIRISRKFTNSVNETDREESGSSLEVIIRGHFYESTGYAKVNRNLALELYKNKVIVETDPVSTKNNSLNEIEARIFSCFRKRLGKGAILIDSVIPTQGRAYSKYNILYTTAESNLVPKQFVNIASDYDELWVASEFSKKSFIDSGCDKKITVISPIINKNKYSESVLPYIFRPSVKSFVFLSVSTWGYRKGSDALLNAFCTAFTSKDDVSLILLLSEKSDTKKKQASIEIQNIMKKYYNPPNILICDKSIPEYQMANFYKTANVFVLPSRGEGFGIPFCEASLCGLPVISTNYGGQLDFLNKNNSTLVDIDYLEKANNGDTGIHYWDGQWFPSLKSKIFIDRLAEALIYSKNNYDYLKTKNKNLQNTIVNEFTGQHAIKAKNMLLNIWNKGK